VARRPAEWFAAEPAWALPGHNGTAAGGLCRLRAPATSYRHRWVRHRTNAGGCFIFHPSRMP